MKIQSAFFCVLMGCAGVLAQENYTTWPYYKNITLNTSASGANVAGNVARFPVLVRLTPTDSVNGIKPENVRFTKADGVTRLKHQVERMD